MRVTWGDYLKFGILPRDATTFHLESRRLCILTLEQDRLPNRPGHFLTRRISCLLPPDWAGHQCACARTRRVYKAHVPDMRSQPECLPAVRQG
jgi:hypothetical protein